MGVELNTYKARVDENLPRIEDLRDTTVIIGGLITVSKTLVKRFKTTEKVVDKTDRAIFVIDGLLSVAGYISPLKTPTGALQKVLQNLKKPVDKIDDKIEEISGKDDVSTPEKEKKNGMVENVEHALTDAGLVVSGVQDTLTLRLRQLEIASEATGNFIPALTVATRGGETWSGKYTALNIAIEDQMGARNDLIESIEALYNSVKAEVDAFLNVLQEIDFAKILGEFVNLDEIKKIFDFLEKPLEIAGNLIEPIVPILNAIGALIDLIVNPVIDFIIETLQLDKILETIEATVNALIPSIELLDKMNELLQPLRDFLLEYAVDALGKIPFLDTFENAFFGDVVGEADQGPTGWGNDVSNTLQGDAGDDILDALGDSDTILGGAGDDIIIAGKGSDFLDGEAGDDLYWFGASFTEYELSRDPDTDNIIVSHLAPQTSVNTGIDVLGALDDTDHVVFTDISFTGAELNNALIGGSILNGDVNGPADDLMFLNSSGTTVGGFHIANGRQGNDRIFGSTEDDQLNGGSGDDILLPGLGDDEANGGSGTDTFQVLEGANSRLRVDLLDGTSFGQGSDTLSSIENVIASPNQDHFVRGTDGANAIYTGDGVDVISGEGGNDTIDSGGEDDYIVGGPGSDVIDAGSGNIDVMISGSAAQAGVSDHYIGGDGFDLVSYTSSSNTIKFDINDQGDDPSILQKLKDYLTGVDASGRVHIHGATGEIDRYDTGGTLISTDTTDGVEGFMGSDGNDTIQGAPTVELLHGAGGNDTIRTGGAEDINGGSGDDVIYAEEVEGGSTALQVDGGSGFDRLLLEDVSDARWYYRVESAIALTLRAHKISVEGEDLRNAGDVFFSLKPRNVEEISLGNFADHAIYEPGGTSTAVFYLLGGNDRFDGENGFADVHAGDGNDIGNFDGGGGGIFRGGAGDDYAVFDDTDDDNAALMGADNDAVQIERFFGHADGGDGFDRISFEVAFDSRIVADLAAGTVESFKGQVTNNADQVGMTLENFEVFVATGFNDLIEGSSASEQLIGRAGNDTIRGGGGLDKIYGGDGNDSLEGGDGEDLLHGGTGNDILNGGAAADTASYAWARPGGLDGALIAGSFAGVTVNLATNTATGAFGSDTLVSIENVIGTGTDDNLTGDAFNNMLSGGRGDDVLDGGGGNDVLVTGSGDDTASGGDGADTVVVGLGSKSLDGGAGIDTLDFGTVTGAVSLDMDTGFYAGSLTAQEARWSDRDLDNDGVEESDGTEARVFGGVALTPQDVLEASPEHANSADDLTRVPPGEDDPELPDFLIELVDVTEVAAGIFTGFEKVVGGDSDDSILGNASGNELSGGAGQDDLSGRAGNDTLRGGDGDDTLDGGAGNDRLTTGAGMDVVVLSLGMGNDTVSDFDTSEDSVDMSGLSAAEQALAAYSTNGSGHRVLTLSDGSSLTFTGVNPAGVLFPGTNGPDTFFGGSGDDTVTGRGGPDLLTGGIHDDRIDGNQGNDTLFGGPGDDTLSGLLDNDFLGGGDGHDSLLGGTGDDDIYGGNGNDSGDGGFGDDILGGFFGHDMLSGNAGNDEVWGAGGNDTLSGGEGNDTVGGSFGDDSIEGNDGSDELWGAAGSDTLDGGAGNDQVGAGIGNDTVDGGDGNDGVFGGLGNDLVSGGAGNDSLFGAGGDDTVDGGAGNDTLFAGPGADVVIFSTGLDMLEFFSTVEDRIDLSDVAGITGFADLAANHLSEVSGNAVIDDGLGNTLTIVGVGQGDLGNEDFIF